MNPIDALQAIPPKIRLSIYLVLTVVNVVLLPLAAAGEVSNTVVAIVNGLSALFGLTAASNVDTSPPETGTE